ncbi:hypothetical protein NJB85_12495 [Myroides odoratimimus]|uniref:hypothetical protein n=1 Tax=Myroides odoratimimus TaxID=76832 RepID=UPI002096AD07|nr:hypothetical protein [Myroides odoratimimus]MCO7723998.1 hypothetical protein [Myroides odoratimimus]
MSLETTFVRDLSEYSKVLEELEACLKYDSLNLDIYQCDKQEKYRDIYLFLTSFELNQLLLKAQLINAPKQTFFGVLNFIAFIIDEIEAKTHRIDAFDFVYLYDKILLSRKFDGKIATAIRDLKDVESQGVNPWVSARAFERELEYWRSEIEKVHNDKYSYNLQNSNLIKNYYYLLRDFLQEVSRNIYLYYPEERLQKESDIFEIKDVLVLYESALELKCFTESAFVFEDFYAIVNLRKPKSTFKGSLKQKTKFASKLPALFENCDISTKKKVIQNLSLELNTAESTLNSYCHKQKESI